MDVVASFTILDTADYMLSVQGSDSSTTPPTLSDISAVATLAISSSDPTVASIDAPVGMSALMHGLAVGSANIVAVATWNDGSRGPFTLTQPVTCSVGAGVNSIVMTLGAPTIR